MKPGGSSEGKISLSPWKDLLRSFPLLREAKYTFVGTKVQLASIPEGLASALGT
jgi:hypothetical protein